MTGVIGMRKAISGHAFHSTSQVAAPFSQVPKPGPATVTISPICSGGCLSHRPATVMRMDRYHTTSATPPNSRPAVICQVR